MTMGNYPPFNLSDWEDVSRENLIENLRIALINLDKFEQTEKDRMRLLKENLMLKEKIDRQNVIEKYIQEEARKLKKNEI